MIRLEDLKPNYLAIHGIDGQIAHHDILLNDGSSDLEADFILANPSPGISDSGDELLRDDKRPQYGVPTAGNARSAIHPAPRT